MEKLLAQLKKRAKKNPKTIVFPESSDLRILAATRQLIQKRCAKIILIGNRAVLQQKLKRMRFSPKPAWLRIIEPRHAPFFNSFVQQYYALRKDKGITHTEADTIMADPLYFGTMLVRNAMADGIISGATHSKTITLRPALQLLGKKGKRMSSFFLMEHHDKYYLFADASVNIDPTAEELADIAVTTADSAKQLFTIKPRVALLSFSTHGSNKHPLAQKVSRASTLAIKQRPLYQIDGELQADAALFPQVCRFKCSTCRLKGKANILIFPDLSSANIAYKLVEWLGQYEAVGPILQGLEKPANDLSRGCVVQDIVDLAVITVVQAQLAEHAAKNKKSKNRKKSRRSA